MLDDTSDGDASTIGPGEKVFDDDGRELGLVVGVTDEGFQVGTVEPAGSGPGGQGEMPGQGVGEGYLMWRCAECGTMGELDDGMPTTCPNCAASGEQVSEVVED